MTQTEALLAVTAFFTSAVSGVAGLGGGALLFAVMASFYPARILIPLHGIVQLGSNVSRLALSLDAVDWKIAGACAVGVVAGALAGAGLVVRIPDEGFQLVLGVSILVLTWMPPLPGISKVRGKFVMVGALNSFLSLFIGATGPLMAAFFAREKMKKEQVIATSASCQALVHLAKILTYFAVGFAAGQYLSLLACMVAASFAGSYAAKRVSMHVPERAFRWMFKGMITLLAARIVFKELVS